MHSAYVAVKHLHVTTVYITIAFFIIRGLWMMAAPAMLERRWVRVLPHVNDTVLLVSGVTLAVILSQYPFVHGWLTAKVLGLVVYIVLGTIALRRGRTRAVRIIAFIGALLAVGYIFQVARWHHPFFWQLW